MDIQTVLISGAVGALTSAITAYFTSKLKVSEERERWFRELSSKYAEALTTNPDVAANMSKQFAIAMLLVERFKGREDGRREKYFLLPSSRLVAGRDAKCDILVADEVFSKAQFAFSADGKTVFLELLGAQNSPFLNGKKVEGRTKLQNGDEITLGKTRFELVMLS